MSHLKTIKKYHDIIWKQKDISGIDKLFNEDVLIHSPLESVHGTKRMKQIVQHWYDGFPSLEVYWDDFIEQGNKLVCRWHAQGIHEGQFLGFQPTSKKVIYSGITIYQFSNNKVSDYWAAVDMENIKNQIKN
ncbi:ester cyclase [Thiotrichales bacterium 19S9-12]|nr:ester cyclase [Thiotrichales bacterium 19S9-11]MCF6811665.1 ester cyclase [Thiotrichales bacterium 19S9-12]